MSAAAAAAPNTTINVDSLNMQKLQISQHKSHSYGESFNIMVAGRRGVGKSTFLQTLCDSFYSLKILSLNEGDRPMYNHDDQHQPQSSESDGCSGSSREELLDPFCVFDALSGTAMIRRCRIRVRNAPPQDSHPIRVELIDTPGIDSHDVEMAKKTINELSWEIERRFQDTLNDELSSRREKQISASHIHVVIYIIPPPVYSSSQTDSTSHRMDNASDIISATDILAIKSLGKFANVLVAIGKCDTIEEADRKMLKNRSFFNSSKEILVPAKMFAFNIPPSTTHNESREVIKAFRKELQRRMPFLICGSKHVDEWQQTRLPEYQDKSQSRINVTDWRALSTSHNYICTSTTTITEGIFRDRRQNYQVNSSGVKIPNYQPAGKYSGGAFTNGHNRPLSLATSSVQSLPLRSDSIHIKRESQKRQVLLVREFPFGNLQLTNPEHCDFALLIDVLFYSYRTAFSQLTDEVFYEEYRMQRITADAKYGSRNRNMAEYLELQRLSRRTPMPIPHRIVPPESKSKGERRFSAKIKPGEQQEWADRRHTISYGARPSPNKLAAAIVMPKRYDHHYFPFGYIEHLGKNGESSTPSLPTPTFNFSFPPQTDEAGQPSELPQNPPDTGRTVVDDDSFVEHPSYYSEQYLPSPTGDTRCSKSSRNSSHRVSAATTLTAIANTICMPRRSSSKKQQPSKGQQQPSKETRGRRFTINTRSGGGSPAELTYV